MHNTQITPGRARRSRSSTNALFAFLLVCTIVSAPAFALVPFGGPLFGVKVSGESEGNRVDIAKVDRSMLDSVIEVQGTIKSITPPREGSRQPYKVTLADDTGSITLIIWQNTYDVVRSQSNLNPGDFVRVRAAVSEFRNEIQMTLKNASDLSIRPGGGAPTGGSPASPAPSRPQAAATGLSDINQSLMGQDVTVQATITDVREPRSERAPFIVTLTQGSTAIPMVFWKDLQAQIADKIRVGNVIRVKAQVSEHRGTLQIKLRNAGDIELVGAGTSGDSSRAAPASEPAPVADAAPATETKTGSTTIDSITEAAVNNTVTIAGRIASSDSIGKGQRLRVKDDSGEIQVILWDNVLSRVSATDLQAGREITVTGRVKSYRGKLEIVPDSAAGVTLSAN